MDNNKIGIVCLHGAGLNSSIWNNLKPLLNFPVLAIDFPNRGNEGNSNKNLTFNDYTESVIDQINKWEKDKIILAVHSIGGCVGKKVAEHFEKKIVGIIGIGAIIPLNGHSFASSMPFPQNILLPVLLKLFGTKPPETAIEKELCNDLTPKETTQIVKHFTPESILLYTSKITSKNSYSNTLYIKLSNDKSLPLDLQEKMAKNLNSSKILTLESGHLPMISKAGQLSEIINSFADTVQKEL
ncbi:MAG: alpha/beta hydrolase [Bacteroidetes bacterium]|nr:alpha/beta hydrolase [Bacteroidota bacterium]